MLPGKAFVECVHSAFLGSESSQGTSTETTAVLVPFSSNFGCKIEGHIGPPSRNYLQGWAAVWRGGPTCWPSLQSIPQHPVEALPQSCIYQQPVCCGLGARALGGGAAATLEIE